jgi:hypothetical protein
MFYKDSYANKIVLVAIELMDILLVKLHTLILQERTRWNSSKDFIKGIVFDTIMGIVHTKNLTSNMRNIIKLKGFNEIF